MARRPRSQKRQKVDKAKPADDFLSVARRLDDKERFEAKLGKIAKPGHWTKTEIKIGTEKRNPRKNPR